MTTQKYFICKHCGNIIAFVKNSGVPVVCCGEKMQEIIPGSVDASVEKHVPQYTAEGASVKVSVGSAAHPMASDHYIEWVSIHTEQGNQRKELKPGQEPEVEFSLSDGDKLIDVFAYCNKHGLWKN